jgi:hypothetical protein
MLFAFLLFVGIISFVFAMPPIQVVANVRGKKYEIMAESVEQFTKKVEELTGIDSSQQTVLFKGKVLGSTDKFDDLGISLGEVLNVVKGRKARVSTPEQMSKLDKTFPAKDDEENKESQTGPGINLDDQSPENMENLKQSMERMLDSNFIEEYFSDEAKIEAARVNLLNNLDKYEKAIPGFKDQVQDIATDPEKWKEAMNNAKKQMLELRAKREELKNLSKNKDKEE